MVYTYVYTMYVYTADITLTVAVQLTDTKYLEVSIEHVASVTD